MSDTETVITDDSDQATLWKRFEEVSEKIVEYQAKFDSKEWKGYDAAMNLQKLRTERKAIQGRLEQPKLVWSHPFPNILPPFDKRTRNEVRKHMDLPPVEGGDNEYL